MVGQFRSSLNRMLNGGQFGNNKELRNFTQRGVLAITGVSYQRNFSRFSWKYWELVRQRMVTALKDKNEQWLAIWAHQLLLVVPIADQLIRDAYDIAPSNNRFTFSLPERLTAMSHYSNKSRVFNSNIMDYESNLQNDQKQALYNPPMRYALN